MSLKVKESTTLFPARETPRHSLWLSKLDMIIRQPYSHTNVVFVYEPPSTLNSTPSTSPTFFDSEIMKRAFREVLVPFYPMAGRLMLNEKGRYEVDCNAQGALFVEVETTYELADFGDFRPSDELHNATIPTCDFSKGLSSLPLIMVQLTRFKCGGVCLGFAQHHHLADAFSHLHFINSWAKLAQGLELDLLPVHDRAKYLAPRSPPQVKFQHLEYKPPLPPLPPKASSDGNANDTTEGFFTLSKDQIDTLKLHAMLAEEKNFKLSTFEILAGHVWRSVCKARGLANDQDVRLEMVVNGRSILNDPPIPKGYFGNIVFYTSVITKAGDLVHKPLWYTSKKVQGALKQTKNSEYMRSAIDYVESQIDIVSLIRDPNTSICPNLHINGWGRMPLYEADFGWGTPKFTGRTEVKAEGQTTIIPGRSNDGTYYVTIRLFKSHMHLFKEYFYDL